MKQKAYDEVKILIDNIVAIRIGYKWGLVDKNYNSLSNVVYDYISIEDNKIWIRYRGNISYVSTDQLPLNYDFIYDFDELPNGGKWAKIIRNNKYGAIDSKSNEIIPCIYDEIRKYRGALWVTEKQKDDSNLYGVYSYKGEIISECVYMCFANPIVKKKIDEQIMYGILDDNSKEIITCEYNSIVSTKKHERFYLYQENDDTINNEIFILSKEGYQFLYSTNNKLNKCAYDKITPKKENIKNTLREQKDIYYCYRESNIENVLFTTETDLEQVFYANFLDIYYKDQLLITCNLAECKIESRVMNDLFICKSTITDKYGLIDKNGYRIPFIYDKMYVDDGLNIIKAITNVTYKNRVLDGILDIMNLRGNYIMQQKPYSSVELFKIRYWDVLKVIENGVLSLYDLNKGKIKLTSRYSNILTNEYHNQGYAEVYSCSGKWGIINDKGIEIVPCIYDSIKKYQDAFFIARNDVDKFSFYTISGKKLENYTFIASLDCGFALVSTTYIPNKYKLSERYYCQDLEGLTRVGIINLKGIEVFECRYLYNDIHIIDRNTIQIKGTLYHIENDQKNKETQLGEGIRYGQSCIITSTKNYSQINALKNGCAAARNNHNKWGYLNLEGDVIVPFIYDFVYGMREDGTSVVVLGNKYGIVSNSNTIILPVEYSFSGPNNSAVSPIFTNGLTLVERDGCYGYLNKEYKEVIPCKYPGFVDFCCCTQIDFYNIGFLVIKDNDKKVGLIKLDNPNTYFIECMYNEDSLILHKDSRAKPMYITALSNTHSIIIDCTTDNIFQYKGYIIDEIIDNYAILRTLINGTGNLLLSSLIDNEIIHSFNYDAVGDCDKQGYLQVMKNNKWGLYHLPSQQEVIQCCYYENFEMGYCQKLPSFNFENKMAVIMTNNKYGFIDKNGATVIECKYDNVKPFENEYAAVYENYYWGFIDENGNKIIDKLEDCLDFSDGLAAIKMNGKWGYINTKGRIIIPCRFADVKSFSDGLAPVAFKIRWGYIDKYNRTIIPFKYEYAYPFSGGIASVNYGGRYGHISKDGHVVDWEYYEDDSYNNTDTNYAEDTWDAMTDGMYGDYPGGDVDYDGLGF